MKRVVLATSFAMIAAPLDAQPPSPPPAPTFDCALNALPPEQRVLAGPAASRLLTDAPEEVPELSRDAREMIDTALARCAEIGRWTENQRELALQYTLMQLTREDMLRRYAAQNVDLTYIDEAVAAAPPEGPIPFEALVARMRAQGVGDNRPDSAGDIVYIYVMLAAQSAEIRLRFDDPNFRPQ